MARFTSETDLSAILEVVAEMPEGAAPREIEARLDAGFTRRTLLNRLRLLMSDSRLVRVGAGRTTRYRLPEVGAGAGVPSPQATADGDGLPDDESIPLSPEAKEILGAVRAPLEARTPVGFERGFLEEYRPGHSFLLTTEERVELRRLGQPRIHDQAAGTYARQILQRLLIDLSYSSSRLEGNTYSLLDTRQLLEFRRTAADKQGWEAQMLLNHKDAIEFLVDAAPEIGFDRHSILSLHALLASDLMPDPAAAGRLRRMLVGIGGSVYEPLGVPQLIEECFEQLLVTASAIEDPLEQALFALVYIPYLQPFDDVNKRVSRLAANIPFVKANLCPLSFLDVPRELYTRAILGVYELRRTELMRDLFLWAYRRSARRYQVVRQTVGSPDPFRLRHRDHLRQVVGEVIRGPLDRRAALEHVAAWTRDEIPEDEQERFQTLIEEELLSVHEGNFVRYRVRPSEFCAWQKIWG